MTRTLSIGDTVYATPCMVTINMIGPKLASGNCQTCLCKHIIDLPMYEDGRGPWKLARSLADIVEDAERTSARFASDDYGENQRVSVGSISRADLLTVLHAWFQADFGDHDAILAAERLAAAIGLEDAQET
jgi:hypothetical protein